jgi:GDP-D-mannose 3',5'-epimerase
VDERIVVAGAGGFIGGHLVADLRRRGFKHLVAVDVKPFDEWYQLFPEVHNLRLDLKEKESCMTVCRDAVEVYNLAADMGGIGFIEHNKALCMLSVLINTHMLMAARDCGVKRFFFSSSACVYNVDKQRDPQVQPLKESDAYPAMAEDGYGWEKLFSERMCRHFAEDFGMHVRVARFHNIYGPYGTWEGGREKAPAAICRKVIHAKATGQDEITIWGDGRQTRSFTWIGDCVKGINLIMHEEVPEPVNLGSRELVTIPELVDIVEEIAGVRLERNYDPNAPRGVNGRNSDNTKLKSYVGWEPDTPLSEGIEKTYAWIFDRYMEKYRATVAGLRPRRAERLQVG